jgi:hypothetical protein
MISLRICCRNHIFPYTFRIDFGLNTAKIASRTRSAEHWDKPIIIRDCGENADGLISFFYSPAFCVFPSHALRRVPDPTKQVCSNSDFFRENKKYAGNRPLDADHSKVASLHIVRIKPRRMHRTAKQIADCILISILKAVFVSLEAWKPYFFKH